jgi:hypothetical protein
MFARGRQHVLLHPLVYWLPRRLELPAPLNQCLAFSYTHTIYIYANEKEKGDENEKNNEKEKEGRRRTRRTGKRTRDQEGE